MRPLILLSNDDGYQAKGLNELINTLRPLGDIVVAAPDGPRSGASASLTSESPVRSYKVREEEGLVVYKCTGTPVDCVKLAMYALVPREPQLVIGGINHGDNSAVNVHYSGTMGVVIEGCLKGIPSIGFSLCNHDKDADFTPLLPYVYRITETVLSKGLPKGTCLNVNFPKESPYQGMRVFRQTDGVWTNEWKKCEHPRGGYYYWLTGRFVNHEPENTETDFWGVNHGYVAITPTQIDMTAYGLLEEMKHWNLDV